ncbi:transposase [Oxyplasma meridianum]|uniref:Transposase n=1 Tax=Oxyplasma meridianum TaxID=3073602 RepID=A0AAX4NDJ3_9ARCH
MIFLHKLDQVNVAIAKSYHIELISLAYRLRMPNIEKSGKIIKRRIYGILGVMISEINSSVAEGLNNKFKTVFKNYYGFKD